VPRVEKKKWDLGGYTFLLVQEVIVTIILLLECGELTSEEITESAEILETQLFLSCQGQSGVRN
jgi:hypothetical protein